MLCIQSHGSVIYSFPYLNFIVQTKPGKDCQVLSNRPMPSLGKMRTRAKELTASFLQLFDTPEGSCGVQSLTVTSRDQVAQLLKDAHARLACISPSTISCVFVYLFCALLHGRSTGRIRVKLTADETNIGKRNHCVLVAFTLLDCPKTVASVDGVHPIGFLDEVENYERLQLALCDNAAEVKDLHGVTGQYHYAYTGFGNKNSCAYAAITVLCVHIVCAYIICICRSTNMKGKAALVQIMQKQSRISNRRDLGVARDVQSMTCRNWGGEGHYHLMCEKQ